MFCNPNPDPGTKPAWYISTTTCYKLTSSQLSGPSMLNTVKSHALRPRRHATVGSPHAGVAAVLRAHLPVHVVPASLHAHGPASLLLLIPHPLPLLVHRAPALDVSSSPLAHLPAEAAAGSLVVHRAVGVGPVGGVVRLLEGALARWAAAEAREPFELVLLGVLHGRARGGEGDAAGGGEGEAGAEEGAQVARGHGRGGEGRGGGGPDGGGREAGRHGGAAGREARGGDARGIVRHLAP